MDLLGFVFVTVACAAFILLLVDRRLLMQFIEALKRFGGGGPPTHPSPAGDVAFLRKPWKKSYWRDAL